MRYALNLADDGRILSATEEQYAAPGQPVVDALPDGNIADYKFSESAFVHDPLPSVDEPVLPTNEERIAQLEEALALLLSGVTE